MVTPARQPPDDRERVLSAGLRIVRRGRGIPQRGGARKVEPRRHDPDNGRGVPFTDSAEPTTFGLAFSRCRQNSSLTITTRCRARLVLLGRERTAQRGTTPSIGNRFAVTGEPETIAGSNAFPVTVV